MIAAMRHFCLPPGCHVQVTIMYFSVCKFPYLFSNIQGYESTLGIFAYLIINALHLQNLLLPCQYLKRDMNGQAEAPYTENRLHRPMEPAFNFPIRNHHLKNRPSEYDLSVYIIILYRPETAVSSTCSTGLSSELYSAYPHICPCISNTHTSTFP